MSFPTESIHRFQHKALGWEVIYTFQLTREGFLPDNCDKFNFVHGFLHYHGRRQICEQDSSLMNHFEGFFRLFEGED